MVDALPPGGLSEMWEVVVVAEWLGRNRVHPNSISKTFGCCAQRPLSMRKNNLQLNEIQRKYGIQSTE